MRAREGLSVLELGGGNSCFFDTVMEASIGRRADSRQLARRHPARARAVRLVRRARAVHRRGRLRHAAAPHLRHRVRVGLIEHFDDRAMARLVALHRQWASEGGLVLIAVPTPTIFYRLVRTAAEVVGLWKFPDETPVPSHELVALARRQGLEVLESRTLWSQILTQAIIAARPASGGGR